MGDRAAKSSARHVKRASAKSTVSAQDQANSILALSALPGTANQRHAMIAEAAYYLALERGFEPGHDVQDWLVAESQIDAALARNALPAR